MPRQRLDKDQIAARWAAAGYSCELWVDLPGAVWTDFVHDTDEMLHLLDGDLAVELQGRVLRLAPGDEILIPAQARHTLRNLGHGRARWLYGHRRARAAEA